MTTALDTNSNSSLPSHLSAMQDIPLNQIQESKTNPRRQFDEVKLHLCRDEKCKVHAGVTRYQPSPQERAARAKEILAERIEKQTRVRILNTIRKKLTAALALGELEMIALDYFERLGQDNHRRLCRLYGWEEKKTKTSWDGSCVDYRTVAKKAVGEMSPMEVQHFLVVCSLVSDLCCPGYNPRQPLARDSNLARTAARFKIDTANLSAAVREELSKTRKRPTLKTNRTTKPKSK